MIAVIADDFTGAAEIGGIGLRHGLKVMIQTHADYSESTDLLIIATDTRSMNEMEAGHYIKNITQKLKALNPDFIYKKVDSVLRGNIKEELWSQMQVENKKRAVLIAANPTFNRLIMNGMYYVDSVPLHETSFANDPQFPVNTSNVIDIIGNKNTDTVFNLKYHEDLPEEGIIIGDVADLQDLRNWTSLDANDFLLSGASGYFNALLDRYVPVKKDDLEEDMAFGENSLYILGSSFPKELHFFKGIKNNGCMISNMPDEIFQNMNYDNLYLRSWMNEIIDGIKKHNKVVISIDHPLSDEAGVGSRLNETLGKLMKGVIEKVNLNELFIEGGSTTFKILESIGISKLTPVQELNTGVIRMRTEDNTFYITTKPGSYKWPEKVWQNNSKVNINISTLKQ